MTARTMTLRDGEDEIYSFLQFKEREILTRAGKLRADVAVKLVQERYESVNAARWHAARLVACAEDVAVLERAERNMEDKGRGKRK